MPLRDEHKLEVVDPASLLAMSAPAGASSLGPSTCNRTLRLFGGVTRTDYALEFVSNETAWAPGLSWRGGGLFGALHPDRRSRSTSATAKFMQSNSGIRVRLAAVPDTQHLMVVSATVPLQIGTVSLRIENLQVEPLASISAR